MRREVASLLVGLSCSACGTVDVHYVSSDGGDGSTADGGSEGAADGGSDALGGSDAVGAETGPLNVLDGSAVGTNRFCGCDHAAGVGCCIPPGGSAFCSDTSAACVGSGGVFIGCEQGDLEGSTCCWSGAAGRGSGTALGTACTAGPAACMVDADCAGGGACKRITCGGIDIGACNATPTCP